MKAPSPAFSFYPKDMLSDENCSAMTLEERGAYLTLLCHAWLEGSIPADHVRLARILKVRHQTFSRIWPAIRPCFEPLNGDESRLSQRRLEQERSHQRERSAINAAKGRKGGRPKVSTKHESRGFGLVKPTESLPSPSPSPSPSPENGTDCGAGAPPLPATIPKPGPPSWSREACDDWIGRYGGTAPGGKIGRALKPVVDRHGWPAVRPAWRNYLEQTDAEYASPPRFAETYGRWSGSAPQARASPTRATVGEKSMAAAARFLARRSDGGEREEGGTGSAVPPGAVEGQRKLPAGGG